MATIFSSSTSSWWRGGRLGRRVPDRYALAEPGCGVRHAPHDLIVAEDPGQGHGRRAGEHAQDKLPMAETRPDLPSHLREHLGLDPEQDHVGTVDGFHVRGDGADAVLPLELLAPLGARVAGDDLAGLDEVAAEDAGDHRLGHHAGSDRRDRGLAQGGHRSGV
jgi:hypothetical protein